MMNVSIVIPVYNEAAVLPEFHRRLREVIDSHPHNFEVWYVNDGSVDETESIVTDLIRQDERVRLINFSRNFGQQAALTAGLDFANGDVVITMDGDGQHPPEYIDDLLALHSQGFDVVFTQRPEDPDAGPFKRITSKGFYFVINLLSRSSVVPGASDFRLMSKEAVMSFRQIREIHRFVRGLVKWLGFRWTVMQIEHKPRIAGETKYGMRSMFRLAFEAIFSFSTIPIHLTIVLGLFVLGLAFIQFLDPLILILSGRTEELVPGWTTLIMSVLILGATQLITLAIIGQYVGLIYEEVKCRPLYLLRGKPVDRDSIGVERST
jgi:glycosyltransferase involved in cell wall biosynthesis